MGFGIDVRIEGLDRVLGALYRSPDAIAATSRNLITRLVRYGAGVVRSFISSGKRGYWRGSLYRSIHGEVTDSWNGQIVSGLSIFRSMHGYAEYVESGRSPGGNPPIDDLIPWVVDKLGVGVENAREVAAAVSMTIGRVGTEGVYMFERSVPKIERRAKALGITVVEFFKRTAGFD